MARNGNSYRGERKRAAKFAKYTWRELPLVRSQGRYGPITKFCEEWRIDWQTGLERHTNIAPLLKIIEADGVVGARS